MHYIERQEELPLPGTFVVYADHQRKRTDICCTIWAVLFSASLFVFAVYSLNASIIHAKQGHLVRSYFPVDSHGKLCGYDKPDHPYLYFPDVNDIVCELSCRQLGYALSDVPMTGTHN